MDGKNNRFASTNPGTGASQVVFQSDGIAASVSLTVFIPAMI
jgi:hypothetical protein